MFPILFLPKTGLLSSFSSEHPFSALASCLLITRMYSMGQNLSPTLVDWSIKQRKIWLSSFAIILRNSVPHNSLNTVVLQICCLSWDSQALTLFYTTIMSVLLGGCQHVTMFLFNVFYSLTCNVHGALHTVFLFFVICSVGFLFFCFVCVCMCSLCAFCVWNLVVWFKINGMEWNKIVNNNILEVSFNYSKH